MHDSLSKWTGLAIGLLIRVGAVLNQQVSQSDMLTVPFAVEVGLTVT